MKFPRSSGILLHVSSLPAAHGIGDLGRSAHEFIDFLAQSGQKIWQVLPLSPTGYGDSPYQCFSAFAGNPLFIDLFELRDRGLLSAQDLAGVPDLSQDQVEYNLVNRFKQELLHKKLKANCRRLGIRVMGDIPIYVAHDSADVWAHPELFRLDQQGRPTAVAGVPPDYFSATGQLWGNPLYRWDVSAKTGHHWWIERVRASLKLFDLMRLDHFRGFEAFWEVPASASTADAGRWVKGPGAELFQTLLSALHELPLVAENLGVITPEVEGLRKQFGFPGMSLLQFAFGNDPQGPSFRPHNYSRELVAYTGGHDNDTTVGWWTSSGVGESTRTSEDIRKEHDFTRAYLGFENEPVNWVFIRAVLASVANIAIIPLQDVLGLGSEARMNLPGTITGNWRWRFRPDALTKEISEQLHNLTQLYDR